MQRKADPEALARSLGSGARVIRHEALDRPIRTGQDFAAAVGCPPAFVGKTLLLRAGNRYAAVLLSLPDRVDLHAAADKLQAETVRLATQDELRQVLNAVPGAVSPFHLGEVPLYVDEKLPRLPTVYVNAGAPGADIALPPSALVARTRARSGRFTR